MNVKSYYGHLTRLLRCRTQFFPSRLCRTRDKVKVWIQEVVKKVVKCNVTSNFGFHPTKDFKDVHLVYVNSEEVGPLDKTLPSLTECCLVSKNNREPRIDIHHLGKVHWTTYVLIIQSDVSLFDRWSRVT